MLYLGCMIANIINLVYPPLCHGCGKKTTLPEQGLCSDCLNKIKKRFPPFCIKCGRQLPGSPSTQDLCSDCKEVKPYYDRAFSVFCYDGLVKELVHIFKYKKMTSLVNEFAELIVDFIKEYSICKKIDIALSIPMHPRRLLQREINPSHILAKNTAKKLGIRYSGNLLVKTKNTPPQSKLKRHERINNIKGSFSIKKNKFRTLQHENVLLVDDLFTTGSTVNECSRILKEAGVNYIEVITLARGDQLRNFKISCNKLP